MWTKKDIYERRFRSDIRNVFSNSKKKKKITCQCRVWLMEQTNKIVKMLNLYHANKRSDLKMGKEGD